MDNPYSESPKWKGFRYSQRGAAKLIRPKLISCHFCGNQWDSKNRCFVCPKCHTPFDPLKSPLIGFGGEVRMARIRANMSQKELAKIIHCRVETIHHIESGQSSEDAKSRPRGIRVRERLRIWIDSTKSPIDKRKEIDDMFKTINQKENENG